MTPAAPTAYELLDRLVSFDTTSHRSNLALIDFVAEYLSGYGIESTRVFADDGGKANLFATVGPHVDGGIVLSGHTDVVPVTDQAWDHDPFQLIRGDGRLIGRGTADMKGFIALALAAVPKLVARAPKIPVHLALSYDEEVGCLGAPRLVEMIKQLRYQPRIVIVGEPTEMKIANRHKSVHRFRVSVTGRDAHSAFTDRGVSAIFIAADLIAFLNEKAAAFRATPDTAGGFDPPYHTVHVGTITGGTADNIIPRHCSFVWEVRTLPGVDVDALLLTPLNQRINESLLPPLRKIAPETSVEMTSISQIGGLTPESQSEAEQLVRVLTGDNTPAGAIAFGTEAGLFQRGAMSTVVYGPGSIQQAHKANEYILIDQFEAGGRFLERLIDHVCGD